MQIELKIEPNQEETKVVIYAKELSQEIQKIMEFLQQKTLDKCLYAYKSEKMYLLKESQIQTIYARRER